MQEIKCQSLLLVQTKGLSKIVYVIVCTWHREFISLSKRDLAILLNTSVVISATFSGFHQVYVLNILNNHLVQL